MKTLAKKTLAAVAALTLGTQAFAAQGDTRVNFRLPGIIVLHHITEVEFAVPSSVFGPDADESIAETTVATSSFAPKEFTLDTLMTLTGTLDLTGYTGTIVDAWAVRALTSDDVQVTVSMISATATHETFPLESNVLISALNLTDNDGNTGTSIQFASPGMGMSSAHRGNVEFAINFDGTKLSGLHEGAVYRIVAAAI